MNVDVDNYEEECGRACTPNGCMGHDSGIPEKITINGFTLTLEPFAHGDWPFLDHEGADQPQEIIRWKETVREIEQRLTAEAAARG